MTEMKEKGIKEQEADANITRYKDHLVAYETFEKRANPKRDWDPDYIKHIEGALVYGVNFGIEEQYDEDIAFGIAIVIGDITYREARPMRGLTIKAKAEQIDQERFIKRNKAKIEDTATWIRNEFFETEGRRLRRNPKRTEEEYIDLLTKLEGEWSRTNRDMP